MRQFVQGISAYARVIQAGVYHHPPERRRNHDCDSYLKKIIDAGFDGVYLDIIDAFEHFEN